MALLNHLPRILAATLLLTTAVSWAFHESPSERDQRLKEAFAEENIALNPAQIKAIRDNVRLGVQESCQHRAGNSKVKFTAVEIAQELRLDPALDTSLVDRISRALDKLAHQSDDCHLQVLREDSWETYYNNTLSLTNNAAFLTLLEDKQFFPVKISWEDIGRYENSVWGDRISDVGIWVRKHEPDPSSAELALSVRRDSNFRDKVLVVPANQIKVHLNRGNHTDEVTLPERLAQLGLSSNHRDRNVIVSNQFAIVPVPAKTMDVARKTGQAPRVAFNFSIYPYGSTNYVITDVIEGSSDAIVGPGNHQLLFTNINGKKAPFTASRAAERPDLLKLERDLKAKGMDVDVQRYYLIQIPLKKDAKGITLANMGTPPAIRYPAYADVAPSAGGVGSGYDMEENAQNVMAPSPAPGMAKKAAESRAKGLSKVAIGHGEAEGIYRTGSGFRGQRADEPIRVTVVYFVTPVGQVTENDMDTFTRAFEAWDGQALWNGSFVVKEKTM